MAAELIRLYANNVDLKMQRKKVENMQKPSPTRMIRTNNINFTYNSGLSSSNNLKPELKHIPPQFISMNRKPVQHGPVSVKSRAKLTLSPNARSSQYHSAAISRRTPQRIRALDEKSKSDLDIKQKAVSNSNIEEENLNETYAQRQINRHTQNKQHVDSEMNFATAPID